MRQDLKITIEDNKYLSFKTEDWDLVAQIDKEFSFQMVGFQYTEAFKNRGWDGYTHLLDKRRLVPSRRNENVDR